MPDFSVAKYQSTHLDRIDFFRVRVGKLPREVRFDVPPKLVMAILLSPLSLIACSRIILERLEMGTVAIAAGLKFNK